MSGPFSTGPLTLAVGAIRYSGASVWSSRHRKKRTSFFPCAKYDGIEDQRDALVLRVDHADSRDPAVHDADHRVVRLAVFEPAVHVGGQRAAEVDVVERGIVRVVALPLPAAGVTGRREVRERSADERAVRTGAQHGQVRVG